MEIRSGQRAVALLVQSAQEVRRGMLTLLAGYSENGAERVALGRDEGAVPC